MVEVIDDFGRECYLMIYLRMVKIVKLVLDILL